MPKLIAILNVIAWSGFWAFGFLALTANSANGQQMTIAAVLAALGAAVGIWAYFQLVRHSEHTGYAKQRNRADRSHLEKEYNEETA
jgi:DMSO/TMAO reductase YedYZ heme-binding membrane subunit